MDRLIEPYFTWVTSERNPGFITYEGIRLKQKLGPHEPGTWFGALELDEDGSFILLKDLDTPLNSPDNYKGSFRFVLE